MTAYKLEQQFDRRREHFWRLERLFVGEVVLSKVDARCEAQEAKHDPLLIQDSDCQKVGDLFLESLKYPGDNAIFG
jgi:hypothetical protein